MPTVLVVNSIKQKVWAREKMTNGSSPLEMVEEYLGRFEGTPVVELIAPGGVTSFPNASPRETEDKKSALVEAFSEIFADYDRIIYLWSDTPFLDRKLTDDLLTHHDRYMSQYTFSDGWPLGLTPEILEKSAMEKLALLGRGDDSPLSRDALFTLIQKDINAFDLETLISPVDFRLLRLELAADSKRNFLLLDRLREAGLTGGEAIAEGLNGKQELLRTLPAFFQFQITDRTQQKPFYLPEPDFSVRGDSMPRRDLKIMLDKAALFAGDGVVSLSFWGEPSLHPEIYAMMGDVLSHEGFRLLMETNGLGWDRNSLDALLDAFGPRIDWVVTLDALDPELYRQIRGEGQDEALGFIDYLGGKSEENLYVQTTRIGESEDFLEAFYQAWKEKPGKLIIKKYDHFCAKLPPRKITELAPWDRNPCWHIKRDMNVLMDGTVLLCQERLDREETLGNLLTEEISDIWERGCRVYGDHLKGAFSSFCADCDEYYTYNF